jgi:hypothetical protein
MPSKAKSFILSSNHKNISNMKKSILSIIIVVTAIGVSHAQIKEGMIAQPTHIVGKRINADGEVTSTLEADFTYNEDGSPQTFRIPDYSLSTYYTIVDGYLNQESTTHLADHPILDEDLRYTYEDSKIKTVEHLWSNVNPSEKWIYTYGDDGQLARKDYNGYYPFDDYDYHYIYDYENEGRTKTENLWIGTGSAQNWVLRERTVCQYDEEYRLLTKHFEDYNVEGEITGGGLLTYTYTPSGKLDTEIKQVLADGEWVNSHIMHYVYGPDEQVLEQQDGSWSAEDGGWGIDHKVVFELSEDGVTYTVSFYKKSGEEWVWDVFNNQTILFGSALKNQQRTMRFYQNEVYNGSGRINQFEMTLVYTVEPEYMGTNDNSLVQCSIYPNPGSDNVKVEAPVEDAVIRFYNLQGQLILARPFDFHTEISAESWPSGMYLWEIWHDNNKEASGKWVKK